MCTYGPMDGRDMEGNADSRGWLVSPPAMETAEIERFTRACRIIEEAAGHKMAPEMNIWVIINIAENEDALRVLRAGRDRRKWEMLEQNT